jgi:putative nucleotidyltransferase with HDIG domain
MMNGPGIQRYVSWFSQYCASFYSDEQEDQRNIALKEEHTLRVRNNAVQIADGLGLGGDDRSLTEMIALFHDVGRFPQYRDFRTFRDSESVNHAALGAKVLIEQNVLSRLPKDEQEIVVRAVTLHNVFTLPGGLDERTTLHARLVRDADKLDIWRVFIELFDLPESERPQAAGLGLPETPEYATSILGQLRRREMVRLTSLGTLNDFKLLQLAWIYDLNFGPSLRILRERDIITRLSATLPADEEVRSSVEAVRRYVDERLGEEQDRR